MSPFTFNPNDLQRLNRLMFTARGSAGDPAGNKRSRHRGEGIDFLDFRAYTPGDDVRKVDWNLYGRLQQLFIRLNESPRQLSVTLLIDTSRSMMFGDPITKLEQAQRIACALGFVAMRGADRVFAYSFADRISTGVGPLTGARGLAALVKFLQNINPGGQSNLRDAMLALRAAGRLKGTLVIFSDFLNIENQQRAMSSMEPVGTLIAVQVLDEIDRGKGLSGNLRLRDSESGKMVDVKIDQRTLDKYRNEFDGERRLFESRLTGPHRHYLAAFTHDHYLDLVCQTLRTKAVVR
ncbi:MAG TPA: DUF58 domain-containing protein [Tepidisphaeraceae bacterium]|jgi:uncharacterized protein (DUF58 family)